MISFAERVGSPTGNLSKSIKPVSSTSSEDSLNVLQLRDREWIRLGFHCFLPIHEWHWQLFCISGFERWIAFNSIPELKAPVSAEETAAPPIPIL
jgi:hypothetical protein